MFARTLIPPLAPEAHAALLARYNAALDPETRTRFQMVLLAVEQDLGPRQIAPLVQRSHDAVLRVLQRYLAGGLDAVPRRKAPGSPPALGSEAQAELGRVIENDPHQYGIHSANWTTQLLAAYLAVKTGRSVNQETIRAQLHRLGYVCKRPTWTLADRAGAQPEWLGNGYGERSS